MAPDAVGIGDTAEKFAEKNRRDVGAGEDEKEILMGVGKSKSTREALGVQHLGTKRPSATRVSEIGKRSDNEGGQRGGVNLVEPG